VRAVAGEDDSGLQAENSAGIAALEGKVGDLIRSEGMTHAGILGIDQWGGPANFHRYGSPVTCILMFNVAGLATCNSTPRCFMVAKPRASTVKSYLAGGSSRN